MLEAAFLENGQLQARHCPDPSRHHLPLEFVKSINIEVGQCAIGNSLRHGDHAGHGERAEADKAGGGQRACRAGVAAGVPAAEGQRVLDRFDAPAFLIQHAIVEHAADRQLGVDLDRIVLEVFIAAIAVDEILPVPIASPNSAAQCQKHSTSLDIERLVVLDDAYGFERVDGIAGYFDRFEEQAEIDAVEEPPSLCQILASAVHAEREGFQAREVVAARLHCMMGGQKNRTAVDPAREAHSDRRPRRNAVQPAVDSGRKRFDIAPADGFDIALPDILWRIEEAAIHWIGIGAAHQMNLGHVVRGRHARVAGMKLVEQTQLFQARPNRFDALGHDEHRAVLALGDEVAQQPPDRAGHTDAVAIAGHDGELPLDLSHLPGITRGHPSRCFGLIHVQNEIVRRIRQINQIPDCLFHPCTAFHPHSPESTRYMMKRTARRVNVVACCLNAEV